MENIIPIITHKAMLKIALNQILNQSSSRGREAEIKEFMKVHMKKTFPKFWKRTWQWMRRRRRLCLLYFYRKIVRGLEKDGYVMTEVKKCSRG